MEDDDLVMESTTDTPEQIADGLDVTLAPAEAAEATEAERGEPDAEPLEAADGAEPTAEIVGDEPVGEVTPEPAKVVAPSTRRPRTKAIDGVAAAARRSADARAKIAETERDAALERIRELTAGKPLQEPGKSAPLVVATVAIKPEDIPDSHPALVEIAARRAALGAKPKQGDFDDFDAFEEKRDQWLMESGALIAETRTVRKDVAAQATIAAEKANRDAAQARQTFIGRLDEARSRHADYDEVMATAQEEDFRVFPHVQREVVTSDIGGELTYYLAKNHTVLDKLNGMSEREAIRELARLEDRIKATLPAKTGRAVKPVSRAPRPQEHVIDGDPGGGHPVDLNDPNLPYASYKVERDRQDRDSGRRAH